MFKSFKTFSDNKISESNLAGRPRGKPSQQLLNPLSPDFEKQNLAVRSDPDVPRGKPSQQLLNPLSPDFEKKNLAVRSNPDIPRGKPSQHWGESFVSSDFERSAIEKIRRAEESGHNPFEVQFAAGALRKDLGLDDRELSFLIKYSVVVDDGNGFKVINRDNFNQLYKQVTGFLFAPKRSSNYLDRVEKTYAKNILPPPPKSPPKSPNWNTNPFGQ